MSDNMPDGKSNGESRKQSQSTEKDNARDPQEVLQEQLARAREEAKADRRALRWLAGKPSLMIGLVTLFAYLLITSFLDAYLGYFSAEPHWFSPGIFQLIAFGKWPLIAAAITLVLFFILIELSDRPLRKWIVPYVAWSVVMLSIMALCCVGYFVRQSIPLWRHILSSATILVFGWLWVPIVGRQTATERKQREAQLASDQEIVAGSMGGDVNDCNSKKVSEAIERIAANRAEKIRFLRQWRVRWVLVIQLVCGAALYWSLAAYMGTIVAFLDFSETQSLPDPYVDGANSAQILFTDGKSALLRQRVGDKVVTLFKNDVKGLTLELLMPIEKAERGLGEARGILEKTKERLELLEQEKAKGDSKAAGQILEEAKRTMQDAE